MFPENLVAEDDVSKAIAFNKFFSSVFWKELTLMAPFERESLNSVCFADKQIIKGLDLVALNKSTGPNCIGNTLLKNCSKTL